MLLKHNGIEYVRLSEVQEAAASHNALVRELDVLLNGEEGAAKQASLCDIVAQVRNMAILPVQPTGKILSIIAGTAIDKLSPSKRAAEHRTYEDLFVECLRK